MSGLPHRLPCRDMQLGTGVFLKNTVLTGTAADMRQTLLAALADDERNLGATRPGGSFRAQPDYVQLGRDGDPSLLLLKGWRVTLAGTLTDCSPESMAALLGPAEVIRDGSRVTVKARASLTEEDPLPRLCWVGETLRGLMIIELTGALNTGGVTLTFGEERCGTMAFRFRAYGGDEEEEPFRVIFLEREQDEAAE